jgi:hypothetical protein
MIAPCNKCRRYLTGPSDEVTRQAAPYEAPLCCFFVAGEVPLRHLAPELVCWQPMGAGNPTAIEGSRAGATPRGRLVTGMVCPFRSLHAQLDGDPHADSVFNIRSPRGRRACLHVAARAIIPARIDYSIESASEIVLEWPAEHSRSP